MDDPLTFGTVIEVIKSAASLSKELLALDIRGDVKGKVAEINAVILSAQSSALTAQAREMELTDRVRKLEKEVVHLKDWDVNREDL